MGSGLLHKKSLTYFFEFQRTLSHKKGGMSMYLPVFAAFFHLPGAGTVLNADRIFATFCNFSQNSVPGGLFYVNTMKS
jgi:hypothetical protein